MASSLLDLASNLINRGEQKVSQAVNPIWQAISGGVNKFTSDSRQATKVYNDARYNTFKPYVQAYGNRLQNTFNQTRDLYNSPGIGNKVMGGLSNAYLAYSLTPPGVVTNAGIAGVTSLLKSARESTPQQPAFGGVKNLNNEFLTQLRNPQSMPVSTGLGVQGPLGMVGDILSSNPEGLVNAAKGGLKTLSAIGRKAPELKLNPDQMQTIFTIRNYIRSNKYSPADLPVIKKEVQAIFNDLHQQLPKGLNIGDDVVNQVDYLHKFALQNQRYNTGAVINANGLVDTKPPVGEIPKGVGEIPKNPISPSAEELARELGVTIKTGEGRRGGLAHFSKTNNDLTLPVDFEKTKRKLLKQYPEIANITQDHVIRHELGHKIESTLSYEKIKEFDSIVKEIGSDNLSKQYNHTPTRGLDDHPVEGFKSYSEAMAESYARWTENPNSVPSKISNFFNLNFKIGRLGDGVDELVNPTNFNISRNFSEIKSPEVSGISKGDIGIFPKTINSSPRTTFSAGNPLTINQNLSQVHKPIVSQSNPIMEKIGINKPLKSQSAEVQANFDKKLLNNNAYPVKPGTKLRGFVSSVKQATNVSPEAQTKVTGNYKPKPNEKLMGEAKALLQEGASLDFKSVQGADKKVAATIQEALNQQKAGNHQAAANLFNNLSEQGTELGRGVQAFSLLKSMSPESIALSAAGMIKKYNLTHTTKIPELTGEQTKIIADKIQAMDLLKGREKNIALNELSNTINSFIPSSLVDKAITVWKAGLLTSLRTHERNFVGNAIHAVAETAKDIPAAGADTLMSLKTGQRSMSFTTHGAGEFGSKNTFQQMRDIVSKGYDPGETLTKFEHQQINWGKTPVEQALKTYTDAVFRTLGASDKPFYNSSLARSLYDQAGAAAINAGKRGDSKFIERLVNNPSEAMMKTAISDANVAVFKNKNTASNVASAIKRSMGDTWYGKLASEITMPFTGVPSSILGQIQAYSPIGLIKGATKTGKVLSGQVPELQRQAAQELGRGVVGTGVFGLGAYLMGKGIITGQPKDAEEQRLWDLQGKQRNSILIGGKWRSLNSIGPEAVVFLAGAKLGEELNSPSGSLANYGGNLAKDYLDQSFVTGLKAPVNAITDPGRYAKSYFGQLISSPIPNLIKDSSRALDPISRESNTVMDYAKSGIPGVRNTLIEKRDPLGNIIPQEPTGLGSFVDLFNSKTPINNPVVAELTRLNSEGSSAVPSKLMPSQTIQKMKVSLTPEQLNNLEAGVGEVLRPKLAQLIASPSYLSLTDDKKAKAIDKLVEAVRTQVKGGVDLKTLSTGKFEIASDSPKTLLDKINVYGTGIFKDPQGTIAAIQSGQPIRKVRGDAVVLERMQGLSSIDKGDTSTVIDHIIPLSLGGSNADSNRAIISTQENQAKAVVEVYLGKQLENGTITKKEAQDRILNWRNELSKLPSSEQTKAANILSKTPPKTLTNNINTSILNDLNSRDFAPIAGSNIQIKIPTYPTLTGQVELDKQLQTSFYSALTAAKTNVKKLYLDGQLTPEEANSALIALTKPKKSSGGLKAKKLPKIKLAKLPKLPTLKIKKPPKMVSFKPAKTGSLKLKKLAKLPKPVIKKG